MNRKFIFAAAISAILTASFAAAPDYRPAFDKTSYKGTVWTQVNPWWIPSKQRVDDSGGPNYARMKHPGEKQWGSAMTDSYHYGKVNWQVELHVSAPGFANGMKHMMQQAKSSGLDVKFSVFLVYYGRKDLNKEIEKTIAQFNLLEKELKNDPSVFRIGGAPVISVYTTGYFTPEEWGKLIPAVEAKCGKFIWLFNTCRNPAQDSDELKGAEWVRSYLPYFDGVSQYGNYSETSQAKHYRWLAEIMHREYPHKILELSCQNTYSNHFHFGGSPTKLSEKWRSSFDTALAAKPDSIVMTNFFDHYENSLILPCYEREDFLLRYAQKRIADWRGETFPKEKTPELVLTNYTNILLGQQKLDFEVIGFPIDSRHKKVTLLLDVCDTSGKILYTFPEKELDLTDLSVAEFSVPSEKFYGERGIVPRLRYKWIGRDFQMNYNPMTLISPSIRSYWMFWARSTKNTLLCNIADPDWKINETKQGGTLQWSDDGIVSVTASVKSTFGTSPRQGWSSMRLMRNGLEFYAHTEKTGDLYLTRAFTLPSPADALNWYHLELENKNGYRYQTLPIWVSNNRRPGNTRIPLLCGSGVREFEIEKARVPYFYYPCSRDDGALLIDQAGYMHNGRLNGKGYGGGHLGYTGYYHYHNGAVAPLKNPAFARDENGKGMLKFFGREYLMIMGGTAFPGASTYEISIRPAAIGERMGIFGTANNQINLSLEPDGRLKLERGSETEGAGGVKARHSFMSRLYSSDKLQAGQWHRIAVVYDLRELKLYLDGKLQGVQEAPPSRGHGTINHLTVGSLCGWVYSPKVYFRGDIRDIRIYGRNLNEKEFLK